MRQIKKGSTSQSVYFEISDSSSTTGAKKTGLVFNSSGIIGSYTREKAAAVQIGTTGALVTQTVTGAWSSGGFVEVSNTLAPGLYRFDVPDAAFASGADSVVVTLLGVTNMLQSSVAIQLVDNIVKDVFDRVGVPAGASVSADIATLNTSLGASAGSNISAIKTQTDKFAFTVTNQVDCNVLDWKSATAPAMTGDAFARLGVPAGASVSADVAAIKTVLPVALVGGRMDSSIGAVASGVIAAASFAANALDAVWSTAVRVLTAGTNIVLAKGTGVTGFNDLDASAQRAAIGMSSANLDSQLNSIILTIPSTIANADALLDRTDGVETSFSLRASMRLMTAALLGRVSGGGTATETMRDINNSKNRIVYTVDANGNRTNVAMDAS